jgi:hypothetical protein
MGRTLVQWASHATWSAPRRAACIGISQQWRAYLTDGNSVTQAQVTSIKKNFIDLTVLAGDRNSMLVAGALLRQPIRLGYASGGTSGHSRTRDVRFWHKADIRFDCGHVRFWRQSRRRPTAASQSRFMSTRPSRRETVHVDCQSDTRPGASSATVRAPRESVVKTLATHASAIPC